jgi:hypothetical protein
LAVHLTLPRSVVVEFFGLPGVGKSHAARLVAARLAASGVPVRSAGLRINHELSSWQRVLSKSGIGAVEALGQPSLAFRAGQTLASTAQQPRLNAVRLFYNWLFLSGLLRRARTRPVVELLDEGIFQFLWTIGLHGNDDSIRKFTTVLLDGAEPTVSMPDVVVVVEAPIATVEALLASRGSRDGRVDRMVGSERRAALVHGLDLLAEVLSEEVGLIGGASGTTLRSVDNATPEALERDVDALAAELASLAG